MSSEVRPLGAYVPLLPLEEAEMREIAREGEEETARSSARPVRLPESIICLMSLADTAISLRARVTSPAAVSYTHL
ncbi:MAG: hypothetical protein MPK62_14280, partial [Alphaproteobacteria bacterium]|nr:hypothetical protein [Alphaproteobacteria bacterium]